METNEKLMTLLRLMDEPEAMTDEQLEELLADDEVRHEDAPVGSPAPLIGADVGGQRH